MKYILVAGTHKEIMKTLTRLINDRVGWVAMPAFTLEEAKAILENNKIDLVLLSSGLSEEFENALRVDVQLTHPACQIVQHYGGGSGLLYNELQACLVMQE